MCQYRSIDGAPNDWHLMHLGRLAIGGCGIVFGEETAVEANGRKTYACAGIYESGHVKAYRRLTDSIKNNGAIPAIQLGHSGYKGSCHGALNDWKPLEAADAANGMPPWQVITASSKTSPSRPIKPKEMDTSDITRVIRAFRQAAILSIDSGYEIIEIHGAHGYLIHQFLSATTNKRNDCYGGCLANRMRLAIEIAEVVRDVWPKNKPVFFRLSAVDGKGGSWELSDSIQLAKTLKEIGIDIIDVSSGGISGKSKMPAVPRIPAYQATFSQLIKENANIKTIAVGGITKAAQAEDILRKDQADIIALARELLWNADWPSHAAKFLGLKDEFAYLPEGYAHRLRLRKNQAKMEINKDPKTISKSLKYFCHRFSEGTIDF